MASLHDTILALLAEKAIDDWVLRRETQRTQEFFFVRDQLDMNRAADTTEYALTVYVDYDKEGERMRGSAEVVLSELDSPEERNEKIDFAIAQAKVVENRYYPLSENTAEECASLEIPKRTSARDALVSVFPALMDAFFHRDHPVAQVNSVELFVEENETQVTTSRGLDVTYPHHDVQFELVTDAEGQTEPVEVFKIYKLGVLDAARIAKIVDAQLEETADRAIAVPAPAQENARVVLTGEAVEEFFDMFLTLANARTIYLQTSRARLGQPLVEDKLKSPLTIDITPALAHSAEARPVDGEGKILTPYRLMENGVVRGLVADAQYAHYLGVPHTGLARTYEVAPGTVPETAMDEKPYIEIRKFSSFLTDYSTGDFGGEFRLARQHDNGTTLLTAGALSENLFQHLPTLEWTVERQEGRHSLVPKAMILDGVTITGAESVEAAEVERG